MSGSVRIRTRLNNEEMQWLACAVCGKRHQRVIQQNGRPDFVFCSSCQSAYIIEDSEQKRLLYGQINPTMPRTRSFALKRWRSYTEVREVAESERPNENIPSTLADHENNDTARPLRETGELPNLDDLFKDRD